MTQVEQPEIRQAGAIPWRIKADTLQILLVTAGRDNRWIIPKGHLEPFLSSAQSAAAEAWEEGGIHGKMDSAPVGEWRYKKRDRWYCVELFSMAVTEVAATWPEQHRRNRRWFPIGKALQKLGDPALAEMLMRFQDQLATQEAS